MTTEREAPDDVPFLIRRSEPMKETPGRRLRYDQVRQIAQVRIGPNWVDAPDASRYAVPGTRITRVAGETTDDE